jgi:hypothetical protein
VKTADAPFVATTAQSIGLVGFTIVVTNTGPIWTSATLSDLPLVGPAPSTPAGNAGTSGLTWMIDPFGSDNGCAITGSSLNCNFGSFMPGAMKRVHITAAAVARSSADSRADNCGQRVENTATVTIDDGSSRQSDRVTVDIVCLPTTADLPRLPSTSTGEAPSAPPAVGTLVILGLILVASRLAWRRTQATH